jgi:hypothetical protein
MTKRNVFTLIVALVVAVSGFSATTGTLVLTGTVAGVVDITVTADAIAGTLDLGTTQTDLKVATVNEKANIVAGYTVTVASTNGVNGSLASGRLNGTLGETTSVAYTVTYNAIPVILVNGAAQITDATAATAIAGVNKDLEISYTGDAGLEPGIYTDTLTLTIAAK